MEKKLKLYFLGSGVFAIPYLRVLASDPAFEIAGCGTQPDRPAGRKRVLTPTPLGAYADSAGIPCERVQSVNTPEFLEKLKGMNPDLVIVVSFGQLLKQPFLELPRMGCLNVHGSILPKYRGAAPVAAVILAGETETGVTFMKMDKGLDTGAVYDVFRMPLDGTETADSLEVTLSEKSSVVFPDVVKRVAAGLPCVPQNEAEATKVTKIQKQDGALRWEESADVILRKIRAYHPWPGCFFRIVTKKGESVIRIVSAAKAEGNGTPGKTLLSGKKWIAACGSGAIELLRIIPEGGKEMNAPDYLRGGGSTADLEHLLNG